MSLGEVRQSPGCQTIYGPKSPPVQFIDDHGFTQLKNSTSLCSLVWLFLFKGAYPYPGMS